MSLFNLFNWQREKATPPLPNYTNIDRGSRYERGDRVKILSVDERQARLGFKPGQTYAVWVDYEDLIYLQSPVKYKTSEDYFYPNQLERV